jgi:O-methyltransferase
MRIITWIKKKGITRSSAREILSRFFTSKWILMSYWTAQKRHSVVRKGDPIRFGTVDLAIEQIVKDQVPGSLAEGGVYQGWMSRFIHDNIPDRQLFLFDTFQGFDKRDKNTESDNRFKDTSEVDVLHYLGNANNIVIRKGYFPETAVGLENEQFCFVMIDFDKYEPVLAALEFFYPRMNRGGFFFIHDYNSPESDWACSKALDTFLTNKLEKPLLIPDAWGTAFFRKL